MVCVSTWTLVRLFLNLQESKFLNSLKPSQSCPHYEEEWSPREYVFAEQIKDGILTETEFMSMIRNEEWKHLLPYAMRQLFNLKDDPNEIRNLWDDYSCTNIKKKLLNQLLEWHIESQVHTHDWAADFR